MNRAFTKMSRNPKAALGYVIMESTEYPPMSGSNTMCTVTAILETGILPMREPETRLTLEAPAGLIEVTCRCEGGRVLQVKFRNVPAFVQRRASWRQASITPRTLTAKTLSQSATSMSTSGQFGT